MMGGDSALEFSRECSLSGKGDFVMMRKFVGFLLVVLLGWTSGASATPYSLAVIADNPVSYWRFEETEGTTAVDEMGANNGTYVGTPQFSLGGPPSPPYAGMVGDQSVGLNGQWVDLGTNSTLRLDNTDFTLEAWIYSAATPDSDGARVDTVFFQGGSNDPFTHEITSFHVGFPSGESAGNLNLSFYSDDGISLDVVDFSVVVNDMCRGP